MRIPVNRASTMIKSSFLADVASMPLHWIYDQNEITAKVTGVAEAAFFDPPSCPFYSYPPGVFSPYGDESVPLLHSIAKNSEYDTELTSEEMFTFFKSYPDESKRGYVGRLNHAPKSFVEARESGKSWKDSAQDDFQANGIAKVPLIVARYAGKPSLQWKVAKLVGILQSHPLSAQCSQLYAKVLEHILLKSASPIWHSNTAVAEILADESITLTDYEKAILTFVVSDDKINEWAEFSDRVAATEIIEGENAYMKMGLKNTVLTHYMNSGSDLATALATVELPANLKGLFERIPPPSTATASATETAPPASPRVLSVNQVLAAVGLSCSLPDALIASLYIGRKAKDFQEAVNLNILAGGDNCSRGMVIGALFGAAANMELPQQWVEKVNPALWEDICKHAEKIESDGQE